MGPYMKKFLLVFFVMLTRVCNAEGIAAQVGNTEISQDEVMRILLASPGVKDLSAQEKEKKYENILNALIYMKLILNAAKSDGLTQNADFKELVERQTEQLLVQFFIKSMKEKILKGVTKAQAEAALKEVENTDLNLIMQKMMVKNLATAQRIQKAVSESGKSFAQLAKEYNLEKGGIDLPPISESELTKAKWPETLVSQIKSAKPGGVILVPTGEKSEDKVLIFCVLKKEKISDPQMLQQLAQEKILAKETQNFLTKLFEKTNIKRFDMNGKPMPALSLSEETEVSNSPASSSEPKAEKVMPAATKNSK